MGGGFGNLSSLGGLVIWAFNLFKGNWKDYRRHKYSFEVGLGTVLLFILILYLKG